MQLYLLLLVRHLGLACRLPGPSFGVTLSISLPPLHYSATKGSEDAVFKLPAFVSSVLPAEVDLVELFLSVRLHQISISVEFCQHFMSDKYELFFFKCFCF